MARATKEQSEATAARVRAVARDLFTAHGYGGVALEDVAARAGVTRGAVYHHYANKLGLFQAVVAEVQHSVAAAIERDTSEVAGTWDKLETGCRTFLSASVDEDARRVLLVDAPAVLGWNAWRAGDAAGSGRLLDDVLQDLAVSGELRDTPVEAASALLSGAMNEAALWVAGSEDPRTATAQAWALLRRMLQALRG